MYRLSRNSMGLRGLRLWCHITAAVSGVKLFVYNIGPCLKPGVFRNILDEGCSNGDFLLLLLLVCIFLHLAFPLLSLSFMLC